MFGSTERQAVTRSVHQRMLDAQSAEASANQVTDMYGRSYTKSNRKSSCMSKIHAETSGGHGKASSRPGIFPCRLLRTPEQIPAQQMMGRHKQLSRSHRPQRFRQPQSRRQGSLNRKAPTCSHSSCERRHQSCLTPPVQHRLSSRPQRKAVAKSKRVLASKK